MGLDQTSALIWLPFVAPIGIWIAWTDMAFMKIPNKAVLALLAVFVLTGPLALPFDEYLWRYTHFGVVLAVGFVLNAVRVLGAGDAKFAAAMAPFIHTADVTLFLYLLTGVLLAAFATHRAARAIPAVRNSLGHWESWSRKDFPMGLALGPALAIYLAIGVAMGA